MIDERVLDWTCQQSNIRRSDAYRMTLAERRRLKQMRFIAGAICVCHAMLLKLILSHDVSCGGIMIVQSKCPKCDGDVDGDRLN